MTSLCFRISAMLGLQCYMLCVSLRCFGYFLRHLYTVTCSMSFWSTGSRIFLGGDFRRCSCIQHLLVRQWIQVRVSLRCSFAFQRNAWFDRGYILPRSSSFSQWHGYCWYAGCDAFALCSLRRRRPVQSPQVQWLRQFQLLALPAGMRRRLFVALCIGTGRGSHVHRDMTSIIRCIP